MATQSPTKEQKTQKGQKPADFVPKSDELLAKDLPRNDAPGQHAGREEATLRPVSLDVQTERAPSSVRKMPTPRPDDLSKRPAEKPEEAAVPTADQHPRTMPPTTP